MLKMMITFGIIHAASFTVKSSETLKTIKLYILQRLKITIVNHDTIHQQNITRLFHIEYIVNIIKINYYLNLRSPRSVIFVPFFLFLSFIWNYKSRKYKIYLVKRTGYFRALLYRDYRKATCIIL